MPECSPALVSGMAAIGKGITQPSKAAIDFAQHRWSAVAVLNVGGVDHRIYQIAVEIGEDVAMRPMFFLLA